MTDHDLSNLAMLAYMVTLFGYTGVRLWLNSRMPDEPDANGQCERRDD